MYKRLINKSESTERVEGEGNSSCSSLGANAKICRICHVVEKKPEKPEKSFESSFKEKRPDTSINNFFKQMIISKFNSANLDEEELIAPCECRGTMRHVHRGCLNQWRTASPRSDSFLRCEQCFAPYTFKHTWITKLLTHPATLYTVCTVLFVAWVAASTFVSTGAMNTTNGFDSIGLFNLLPVIELSRGSFLSNINNISTFINTYNNFLSSTNRLFYGLIFVSLTEYIFFTPSFILSFNTLFCIWRIQKYEIFFDKWLLVAFALFGVWRAAKSLHGMIEAATSRIVKLKLLEVLDREDEAD